MRFAMGVMGAGRRLFWKVSVPVLPVHALSSCALSTFVHWILSCISLPVAYFLRIVLAARSYQRTIATPAFPRRKIILTTGERDEIWPRIVFNR
jgi:hypothetical protein